MPRLGQVTAWPGTDAQLFPHCLPMPFNCITQVPCLGSCHVRKPDEAKRRNITRSEKKKKGKKRVGGAHGGRKGTVIQTGFMEYRIGNVQPGKHLLLTYPAKTMHYIALAKQRKRKKQPSPTPPS